LELKVERLVTTEKADGTTEEKVVLKGDSDVLCMTLTITGEDVTKCYVAGEPFSIELDPLQTTLDEAGGKKK